MRSVKLKSILVKRRRTLNKLNRKRSRNSVKFKRKLVVEFPIPKSGKSRPVKRRNKNTIIKNVEVIKPSNKVMIKPLKNNNNRRSSIFSRKNRKPVIIQSHPILKTSKSFQ